jgi:hypothetical protein
MSGNRAVCIRIKINLHCDLFLPFLLARSLVGIPREIQFMRKQPLQRGREGKERDSFLGMTIQCCAVSREGDTPEH